MREEASGLLSRMERGEWTERADRTEFKVIIDSVRDRAPERTFNGDILSGVDVAALSNRKVEGP